MEESIYKGLDDFNMGKTSLNEDDASSVNTDIPSDPWLDDQDINFNASFLKFNKKTVSNNENFSFFSRNELDESNLKENEIDLYNDLVMIEDEEKRSKLEHDFEVENLKKELKKLKEADVNKSKRISELLKENTNLKKSICSLYQTVKSEIEHKDHLLAEANRKIDNILFRKNSQNLRNDKSAKTSNSNIDASNQNSHKRKRSPEPRNEKESESSLSNPTNSNLICDKRTKHACDKDNLKSNYSDSQAFENCNNPRAALQAPEAFEFSKDSTETNNLFFNILPASLRKAFHEYEQSQVVSLNKLKQSYINEYFNADKCSISKTELSSKRASDQNTFFQNHNSVSGSYATQKDKTVACHRSNGENNCRITTSMQNDLVSLFKYRKERIPFLDKRKFGLLKQGKALIPENLL